MKTRYTVEELLGELKTEIEAMNQERSKQQQLQAGKEKLRQLAENAKGQATRAAHVAKERGQDVDRYVRTHPWQVAAGAAVTGVLVGFVAAKQSTEKSN